MDGIDHVGGERHFQQSGEMDENASEGDQPEQDQRNRVGRVGMLIDGFCFSQSTLEGIGRAVEEGEGAEAAQQSHHIANQKDRIIKY